MPNSIAEDLRQAISHSGRSANDIAKAAGIPQTTLAHFLRGHDMSINRCSKVAAHLGLFLTRRKQK